MHARGWFPGIWCFAFRVAQPFEHVLLLLLLQNVVNIVDLFGFECDETNSLEQLCVNWTAEKLQSLYTQFVFEDTLKTSQWVVHSLYLSMYLYMYIPHPLNTRTLPVSCAPLTSLCTCTCTYPIYWAQGHSQWVVHPLFFTSLCTINLWIEAWACLNWVHVFTRSSN